MKNITKILLAAVCIGATETQAKAVRLDAGVLGHFSWALGQNKYNSDGRLEGANRFPTQAGALLNLALCTDFNFPLQGGLVILAGAGVSDCVYNSYPAAGAGNSDSVVDSSTARAPGFYQARKAGFYGEFMMGPIARLQFGFFGMGVGYLLGYDGSLERSGKKETRLVHGVLAKMDFDMKSTVFSVGATFFKRLAPKSELPVTVKFVFGFGKKLI